MAASLHSIENAVLLCLGKLGPTAVLKREPGGLYIIPGMYQIPSQKIKEVKVYFLYTVRQTPRQLHFYDFVQLNTKHQYSIHVVEDY